MELFLLTRMIHERNLFVCIEMNRNMEKVMDDVDGCKKFRSRAIIIKTALRFITKTRRKNFLLHEEISLESLSLSSALSSASYSPSLSLDLYYHQQEKSLSQLVLFRQSSSKYELFFLRRNSGCTNKCSSDGNWFK